MHELKQKNYIELFPGKLFKGYLNEESIYINDDSFSLIAPAIRNGFKCYTGFERLEIEKTQWYSIIKELLKLMRFIEELIDWIKTELEENETITLIGL